MSDLIPVPESISPRLAWLRKHGLILRKDQLPRCYIGPAATKPFACGNVARTLSGFGDTEEEATFEAAKVFHVEHWLETELQTQVAFRAFANRMEQATKESFERVLQPPNPGPVVLDWEEEL